MMPKMNNQETMLKNYERINMLFERYIDQFTRQNMPDLANRWKNILVNYRRAVHLKVHGQLGK